MDAVVLLTCWCIQLALQLSAWQFPARIPPCDWLVERTTWTKKLSMLHYIYILYNKLITYYGITMYIYCFSLYRINREREREWEIDIDSIYSTYDVYNDMNEISCRIAMNVVLQPDSDRCIYFSFSSLPWTPGWKLPGTKLRRSDLWRNWCVETIRKKVQNQEVPRVARTDRRAVPLNVFW